MEVLVARLHGGLCLEAAVAEGSCGAPYHGTHATVRSWLGEHSPRRQRSQRDLSGWAGRWVV
eukprot:15355582-Alexandrium_andersonii.AAC.1